MSHYSTGRGELAPVPRCACCGQVFPVLRLCQCGHLDSVHNISGKGERTACSVLSGPTAVPCGCKRFTDEISTDLKESQR